MLPSYTHIMGILIKSEPMHGRSLQLMQREMEGRQSGRMPKPTALMVIAAVPKLAQAPDQCHNAKY